MLLTGAFLVFGSDRSEADEGLASWYGPGFEGRNTASGEPFDPNGYTAAHKTLPFGTNLIIGYGDRSVPVRVNDRGPFLGTRELDLSQAAARDLGLIPAGVDYVEYDIVGSPGPDPSRGVAQQPVLPSQTAAQQPGLTQGAAQQPDLSQGTAQQPTLPQGVAQQPGLTETDSGYQVGYPDYESYPAAQGEANGGTYVIQPGDTLSQIAAQLGVPTDYLARYNGITDPDTIYSGQPLHFLTLEDDPVGAGGYRATGDAAIHNPPEMGDNATVAGLGVAVNDGLIGGSNVPVGYASEDGGLWVPGRIATPGGAAIGGGRYMPSASGG